jgi:hypothetical protein
MLDLSVFIQIIMPIPIYTLVIPCVEQEYTAEYIADVFWTQHLAKVKRIVQIPYSKKGIAFYCCLITIDQWRDSETAYNFISRLKTPTKETRIVHCEDNWWAVYSREYPTAELRELKGFKALEKWEQATYYENDFHWAMANSEHVTIRSAHRHKCRSSRK